MTTPHEPGTPAEWQEAVDPAEFMLLLESCLQYGLVTGPKVNVRRCELILMEGKNRGFVPNKLAVL